MRVPVSARKRQFLERIIKWDWPDAPGPQPGDRRGHPKKPEPMPKFPDDAARLMAPARASADPRGEPLLDGHPAGVLPDEVAGGRVVVVGDDHGGGLAARAGDDQVADGAGVGIERDRGVLVHPGWAGWPKWPARSRVTVVKSPAAAWRCDGSGRVSASAG